MGVWQSPTMGMLLALNMTSYDMYQLACICNPNCRSTSRACATNAARVENFKAEAQRNAAACHHDRLQAKNLILQLASASFLQNQVNVNGRSVRWRYAVRHTHVIRRDAQGRQ